MKFTYLLALVFLFSIPLVHANILTSHNVYIIRGGANGTSSCNCTNTTIENNITMNVTYNITTEINMTINVTYNITNNITTINNLTNNVTNNFTVINNFTMNVTSGDDYIIVTGGVVISWNETRGNLQYYLKSLGDLLGLNITNLNTSLSNKDNALATNITNLNVSLSNKDNALASNITNLNTSTIKIGNAGVINTIPKYTSTSAIGVSNCDEIGGTLSCPTLNLSQTLYINDIQLYYTKYSSTSTIKSLTIPITYGFDKIIIRGILKPNNPGDIIMMINNQNIANYSWQRQTNALAMATATNSNNITLISVSGASNLYFHAEIGNVLNCSDGSIGEWTIHGQTTSPGTAPALTRGALFYKSTTQAYIVSLNISMIGAGSFSYADLTIEYIS